MAKGITVDKPSLVPYLVVSDGMAAIEFYKKAFGAVEECCMTMPGTNQVMHASLKIGDSHFMLSGEMKGAECSSVSPLTLGGTPVSIHITVPNVDEAFKRAVDAGAEELTPPADMFWGDRYGRLKDPFGHEWSLSTPVREMSPKEIEAAAAEFFRQPQQVG
jgi:PhnB protein